jgi:F-type H+-transporting ATPase subunit c
MLGIGIGIAGCGCGLGLGIIGYGALQGMARQPDAISRLQIPMLIALAFVELVFLLSVFAVPGMAGGK